MFTILLKQTKEETVMIKIRQVSTNVTSMLKKIKSLFPVEIRHEVQRMVSLLTVVGNRRVTWKHN